MKLQSMPPIGVTAGTAPKPILDTLPPEFVDRLKAGIAIGRFMLAVWTIENGQIHMHLVREKYPNGDHDKSTSMLAVELHRIASGRE